jgi:hypothetical protein
MSNFSSHYGTSEVQTINLCRRLRIFHFVRDPVGPSTYGGSVKCLQPEKRILRRMLYQARHIL